MARRSRNSHDPLAQSDQARWYVARDSNGVIVECERLEPGSDLRAILREVIETRAQRGWVIELEDEPRFSEFFCSQGDERLCVCIQPSDPEGPKAKHSTPYGPPAARIEANATDMHS